jgi:uncharacterized membrane protein
MNALLALWPIFLSYLLSFIYLAIYWNNHHHLFQVVKHVNGSILWANMHLLFWLSLLPFVTAWSGENDFADLPVALYGVDLFFAAIAYYILARVLVRSHGADSTLAKALGQDFKGKISIILYAVGIYVSFYSSMLAFTLYGLVALMWIIPDRRIEKQVDT